MKKLAIFFVAIMVGACAPMNNTKEPTPFTPTNQKVIVVGCEMLHAEVEEWNKANPDDQRVADC